MCLNEIKNKLTKENLTCILTNGVEIFTSRERGVRPIINFIDSGKNFTGYFAADKIVGKAAALLYSYMGITALYAHVIGKQALEVCKKFKITVEYGLLTDKIINRSGDDICPMEKTVADISDPYQAYISIKEKLKLI